VPAPADHELMRPIVLDLGGAHTAVEHRLTPVVVRAKASLARTSGWSGVRRLRVGLAQYAGRRRIADPSQPRCAPRPATKPRSGFVCAPGSDAPTRSAGLSAVPRVRLPPPQRRPRRDRRACGPAAARRRRPRCPTRRRAETCGEDSRSRELSARVSWMSSRTCEGSAVALPSDIEWRFG
jgi:hypothetical protein